MNIVKLLKPLVLSCLKIMLLKEKEKYEFRCKLVVVQVHSSNSM